MKSRSLVVALALVALGVVVPSPVLADGITVPTPCLPPIGGAAYVAALEQQYMMGLINLNDVRHSRFTDCLPPPPPGGTQVHNFGSLVQANVVSPILNGPVAAPANVAVRVESTMDAGNQRFFDTEMLALNIAGGNLPPGVMLRESPTRQSLGKTTITQLPGGGYHIDSFFDIFTELSLDGGQTWTPSDGVGRVTLVPEPSSVVLAILGGAGLITLARRRRSR